jgi:hypothetical protein
MIRGALENFSGGVGHRRIDRINGGPVDMN